MISKLSAPITHGSSMPFEVDELESAMDEGEVEVDDDDEEEEEEAVVLLMLASEGGARVRSMRCCYRLLLDTRLASRWRTTTTTIRRGRSDECRIGNEARVCT